MYVYAHIDMCVAVVITAGYTKVKFVGYVYIHSNMNMYIDHSYTHTKKCFDILTHICIHIHSLICIRYDVSHNIFICVSIYTYILTHIYTHTYVYGHRREPQRIHMCEYIYICTNTYVYSHLSILTHMYTHTYVYIHICILTHKYMVVDVSHNAYIV